MLVVVFGFLAGVAGVVGFGGDDARETVEAAVAGSVFLRLFAEGPDSCWRSNDVHRAEPSKLFERNCLSETV